MYTPAIVEFLGTSLLIGSAAFSGTPAMIIAAFAIAVGLGGKISGGHFNPAVTAWSLLSGKISQEKAITYMMAQLAAAVFIFFSATLLSL